MKPAPFDYNAPRSLPEAIEILDRFGSEACVIAGGQSLVPMLALRLVRPKVLVDLNRIPELVGIREDGGAIRIGAATRQARALISPIICSRLPLLSEGLEHVGHPPIRARGTIGGSLSHADPAAEISAVMIGYRAHMVVTGSKGERRVDACDFTLGTFETCIKEGEILKEIVVDVPRQEGTAIVELSRRKGDFALASAAARLRLNAAGYCAEAHLVVGAVAPTPFRCHAVAEALQDRKVSEALIREAVSQVDVSRFEFDSPGISLAYRRHIGLVLARRALTQAFERAKGLPNEASPR
jgi:aerobic carbon-monoxide dehydrogenase medium subunit